MESTEELFMIVGSMRPNDLDESVLRYWLSQVEGKVVVELWGDNSFPDIDNLNLQSPYDQLYVLYLVSMIDFSQRNMEAYEQSRALADKAWEEFKQYAFRFRKNEAEQVL